MSNPAAFTSLFCVFGGIALLSIGLLVTFVRIVPEYKRLAVYRLGKYLGERGPGVVFVIPLIDRAVTIDKRGESAKARDAGE